MPATEIRLADRANKLAQVSASVKAKWLLESHAHLVVKAPISFKRRSQGADIASIYSTGLGIHVGRT
jgi:hypothetical protein